MALLLLGRGIKNISIRLNSFICVKLRAGGETPPLQLHLNNIDAFLNYCIFPSNCNEQPAYCILNDTPQFVTDKILMFFLITIFSPAIKMPPAIRNG